MLELNEQKDYAALREGLAQYAHEAWSGWMKYMFEKGYLLDMERPGDGKLERCYVMPHWAVERWTRQMNTAYADLSEEEKESDRLEADRMIEIMDKTPTNMPDATKTNDPEWIQDRLPELELALGYHHSWRSGLVFVFHDMLGRTQATLYAGEGQAKMWWVLRDAQIGERESLGSMWGWLPLSELPGKPPGQAAWQIEKPRPPEWIEKLKKE